MQTVLFAIPIKAGKLEEYKKFAHEITGPRKQEYNDMLHRYGLKTAKVWHRKFSGQDFIMVVHDMEDDAGERLKGWLSSMHPFDRWFNEQMFNCYDAKDFDSMPEQPQFLYEFKAK